MTDKKYDQVTRIEIGWSAAVGQHVDITNIVGAGDRLISRDGAHVSLIKIQNTPVPRGVHQNQKMYEIIVVLDSDDWEAFHSQRVQAGDPNAFAILQGADNPAIEYFAIFIREENGTTTSYVYASGEVWCVSRVHNYSNQRNRRHLGTTEYRLICLGTRSRTGW